LEGDPPSRKEDDGCKLQGERTPGLISKGKVEVDRVCPIIIVTGKEDLLHPEEGYF
jgi:hypothetical protein